MSEHLYHASIGPLAVDKYALTMPCALFEAEAQGLTQGLFDAPVTFQMFTRSLPRTGVIGSDGEASRSAYLITAGLPFVLEWLSGWRFSDSDIKTLARQKDPEGSALFSARFLDHIKTQPLQVTLDAMPDGTLAQPHQPIVRVNGPFWQCVMLEGALLNLMNSTSLYATLTSHLVQAAQGRPVWEFGLRRAQDHFGLAPAYGAFVGGAAGSSNLLADKFFEIPSAGTMAHAFIMLALDEVSAFKLWAKGMPNLGVFLVDTFDTIHGIKNAIDVCKAEGIKLRGVRLDSGDLAYFAAEARQMLDRAGFHDAVVFAQNDLDPAKINSLMAEQQAKIDVFGVGTWLSTAQSNPALGGVYKLASVELEGQLHKVMKFSEEAIKTSLPGAQEVLRMHKPDGRFMGDVVIPREMDVGQGALARDLISINPQKPLDAKLFPQGTAFDKLLSVCERAGVDISARLPLVAHEAKARAADQLARLEPAHKRLSMPHRYVSGVEEGLYRDWTRAIEDNNRQRRALAAV